MEKQKQNKSIQPESNKMVKVKLNKDVAGIGKAEDVVEVSELVALNFVSQGFAAILENKKEK